MVWFQDSKKNMQYNILHTFVVHAMANIHLQSSILEHPAGKTTYSDFRLSL